MAPQQHPGAAENLAGQRSRGRPNEAYGQLPKDRVASTGAGCDVEENTDDRSGPGKNHDPCCWHSEESIEEEPEDETDDRQRQKSADSTVHPLFEQGDRGVG